MSPYPFPSNAYQPLGKDGSRRKWRLSFTIAVMIHLVIFGGGGFGLIQPASYGIQGANASIDIYMVAALPQASKNAQTSAAAVDIMDAVETNGDMKVQKQTAGKQTSGDGKEMGQAKKRSKKAGDGSSSTPGEDVTTLFSAASSQINAKPGKYKNLPPQYPSLAREMHQEGVVVLEVSIDKNGYPSNVRVDKSSRHALLDNSAMKAVSQWRFEPAFIGNMPVASKLKIPIRFDIEEDSNY